MTQADIRKLITIRKIDSVSPIEGADAIETAAVGGWRTVVAKSENFAPGDSVVFFEIDSFLPEGEPAWNFLVEKSSRKVLSPEGVEIVGHVLRTIKLRGQISQGLVLNLDHFGLTENTTQEEVAQYFAERGVFKYEPPLPVGGAETVAAFPSLIKKTDSERVQNLSNEFLQNLNPDEWVASEKIDGTSSTFWKVDGVLHGAGRNWELSLEGGGTHAQIARDYKLEEMIPEGGVLQGEIFGEGIQGNPLKIRGRRLAIFSTGVMPGREVDALDWVTFAEWVMKNQAPILDLKLPTTIDEAIEQVNGLKSTINPQSQAEGVVWWNKNMKSFDETGDRPNFKSINNAFLAKMKD